MAHPAEKTVAVISVVLLIISISVLIWRINQDTVKVQSPASVNCPLYRDSNGHCGIYKDRMCWLGTIGADGQTCGKQKDNAALAFLIILTISIVGLVGAGISHFVMKK